MDRLNPWHVGSAMALTVVVLGAMGIGLERLFQHFVECGKFARLFSPAVLRRRRLLGVLSHLRIVLREKPVRFVISCSDSLSRKYIRRIFPNISIVITFISPA